MRKKELALEIVKRLKKEYPDAACTLDISIAWKLLISVRLAAQQERHHPRPLLVLMEHRRGGLVL